MIFLRICFAPFALIYHWVTWLRNYGYDKGIYTSTAFDLPTLCVGNLTVGGTGKTPMVEYLVRLLQSHHRITILSRGYGRKTKGFIHADASATPATIGDEPMQYHQKFGNQIDVVVGEKRVNAIKQIQSQIPATQLVILDDAFQHRALTCKTNILLSDYHRPFYTDWLLPTGLLRESRQGAKRADAVVVTKCPNLSELEREQITERIHRYTSKATPVFFASIAYGEPVRVYDEAEVHFSNDVFLFSGIANDQALSDYAMKAFHLLEHISFRDHHKYTVQDVKKIVYEFEQCNGNDKVILTTEKDKVKLQDKELKQMLIRCPIFYLPIEVQFPWQKEAFDQFVRASI